MYVFSKIDWTGSRALKTGIIIRNQQNGDFSGWSDGIFGYALYYSAASINVVLISRFLKLYLAGNLLSSKVSSQNLDPCLILLLGIHCPNLDVVS